MDLVPLSGSCGAEVSGVDLAGDLSSGTVASLRDAFNEHHVLVFRDQYLSPDAQLAFGRHFGELDTHPFVAPSDQDPYLLDIITEPDDRVNFGGGWHSDLTFLEAPDLGSVLYAIEVPPAGGDTLFANQQAAYEALSPTMQGMIDGLTAVHSARRQYAEGGLSTKSKSMSTHGESEAFATVEHPVVRTHPENGRRGLFVNPAFTERITGLRHHESAALLDFLYSHGTHQNFTCRVRWEPGTLTMWDNRAVQHWALHDYRGQRRHMRRLTIKGDRPV